MKAHINGITVEGTPEEIVKYQELIRGKAASDKNPYPAQPINPFNPNVKPYTYQETPYNPLLDSQIMCDATPTGKYDVGETL